ncbi:hypothetical protein KFK09_027329 [Dendrobium nobile]|uniref:Uncharacterized protein n=1 Tax=Dendrobium nobile TaxID=94219 RepID=A0A8T3AAF0_DENNO|nr:hypothetical protein KFK09_027329 [Dendrobium nobile]
MTSSITRLKACQSSVRSKLLGLNSEVTNVEASQQGQDHEEIHDPSASKPHGKSKDLISGFDSRLARVKEVMNGMETQVDELGERENDLEDEDIIYIYNS